MTHRLQISSDADGSRISFQGVLDRLALDDVLSHAAAQARRGRPVVLVLAEGTEVHRECLERLRGAPGLKVEARSRFLARWLTQCGFE